jgi:hypothetical protein
VVREIFPIVDSIASCYFIATGKLVELSYQQVLDCTPGHPGVIGAYWKYILSAPGIDSGSCYPYNPTGTSSLLWKNRNRGPDEIDEILGKGRKF